jgi:XTP/dITP diphosphohydrolase
MRALILATQNDKKRRELEEIADGYVVKTLADVGLQDLDIVEDADTFSGNAKIKVEAVTRALEERGMLGDVIAVLADDSGIEADALDKAPGVRSARFASDHGFGEGDADNNRLLLERLAEVPDDERTGRFVCAIAIQIVDGPLVEMHGTVEGRIARDERGEGGFGYDPLFIPDDHPEKRTAELSSEEKHAISHRGKATRAALARLRELIEH